MSKVAREIAHCEISDVFSKFEGEGVAEVPYGISKAIR